MMIYLLEIGWRCNTAKLPFRIAYCRTVVAHHLVWITNILLPSPYYLAKRPIIPRSIASY